MKCKFEWKLSGEKNLFVFVSLIWNENKMQMIWNVNIWIENKFVKKKKWNWWNKWLNYLKNEIKKLLKEKKSESKCK
jgi:hypothetical protein